MTPHDRWRHRSPSTCERPQWRVSRVSLTHAGWAGPFGRHAWTAWPGQPRRDRASVERRSTAALPPHRAAPPSPPVPTRSPPRAEQPRLPSTRRLRGPRRLPTYLAGRLDADGMRRWSTRPARLGPRGSRDRMGPDRRGHRVGRCAATTAASRCTPPGSSRARQAVLVTNVFTSLLRTMRRRRTFRSMTTCSLTILAQRDGARLVGICRLATFHYYRLTRTTGSPWAGIRLPPGAPSPPSPPRAREHPITRPSRSSRTSPSATGGAGDRPCSGSAAFFGCRLRRQVAYATGFTGLGVGRQRPRFRRRPHVPTCSPARDRATRLRMVRERRCPSRLATDHPTTRWASARADETGPAQPGLRTLDRMGLGFDS